LTKLRRWKMRPFSPGQEKFLKAFTEALFHNVTMAISPAQVVENIQTHFEHVSQSKVDELRLSFTALSVVLGGLFFRLMPVAMRVKRIEQRIQNSKFDLFQDMARLRGIVYGSYYGHWVGASEADNAANPVHQQIGFILPLARTRRPDEDELTPAPNRDLADAHVLEGNDIPDEVDVIIIGSGCGGGIAAHNIAQAGHSVLVLEAGPFYPSNRISFEERRMTAKLFKHGALQTSKNNDFVVFQSRVVGGGSVLNNGICFRPNEAGYTHPAAEDVFSRWNNMGATLDWAAVDAAFDSVEARLQIQEIDHKSGRRNGPHLLNGFAEWKANGAPPEAQQAVARWFRKNYGPPSTTPRSSPHACSYCGYCNTGCPYGRKKGMVQSYLPAACTQFGARVVADAKVEEIIFAPDVAAGRKATGVRVSIEDSQPRTIRARKGVVLAAGTIASSRILRNSGVPAAGYGISLNVASPIIARMPDNMATSPCWDEDQMATYVDMGDYLIESHFQPPMSMAAMMPGWFAEHARRMQNYGKVTSAGILFPADRKGHLDGSKLDFKLDGSDMPLIRKAAKALTEIHFAAGAEEVYPALVNGKTLRRGENIDAFFANEIRESDDILLSSSHPHGGNPINVDPALGVVDTNLRLHGSSNVYVTDASVMPSCIRVNAQLTTMALAQYATGRGDVFR
jgi:choline dehydrogenase-like flavoprotein